MVIEVKTNMTLQDVGKAVDNIVSAKKTEDANVRRLIGVIFAFGAPSGKAVLRRLRECECDRADRPVAIILFDQGSIIHQADLNSALRYGGGESEYELRKCVGGVPSALALTYLLLLFLHPQFSHARAVSFGELLDATRQFLRDNTRLIE